MTELIRDLEREPVDGTRRLRTARSAFVVVGLEGPVLTQSNGEAALPLDAVAIELIAQLSVAPAGAAETAAAIAGRTGSTTDDVLGRAALLLEYRALVEALDDGPPAAALDPTPVELTEVGSIPTDEQHVFAVPTVFRVHDGSFEHRNHDGRLVLALGPVELQAASSWREPCTFDSAYSRFTAENPSNPLDQDAFAALAARLRAAGLLLPFDPAQSDDNEADAEYEAREELRRHMRILHATDIAVEKNAKEVAEQPGGSDRVPVIPIHDNWVIAPLSLGMIVAYAKAYKHGELERSYNFVPRWLVRPMKVAEISDRPSVFLFSNYIWSSTTNLGLSALLKSLSPTSITVHGGPDTPKYAEDVQRFFRDNPHVDVAVHGEGEATFAAMLEALAGHVGDGPPDLSPLAEVEGLSFRLGDRVVTTPSRDRISDLDTIPSPYLTGLFDPIAAGPGHATKLETNRGCPYGCTFCDWGSATNSRIRKFDLDRVFAEIEWSATHGFDVISICDANFGVFERDVAIAQKIAEMKETYGYPRTVGNNYAKNTVKHLKEIIKIFADVGIIAEGIVSLQSMDTDTLQVIRRKNIKVEKYTELAAEFTANRLPLAVDLMMALPGSSVDSFKRDLQACADRDVRTRVHPTTMLTNSPMNEPSYRAEHGIVAKPGEVIKRTNTFDEADWAYMWDLRNTFLICDLFSILRQVARYVRAETGIHEIAFYDRLMRAAYADPERWPTVAFTFRSMSDVMVPPCSWSLFIDEVGEFATSELGVPDDAALQTVLAAQLLHLPARDRQFPQVVETTHDIAAWHRARLAACEAGHLTDWEKQIPPLRSYGPGTLTIDDPEEVCKTAIGGNLTVFGIRMMAWDLESAIARPRNAHRHDPQAEMASDAAEPAGATPIVLSARSAAPEGS